MQPPTYIQHGAPPPLFLFSFFFFFVSIVHFILNPEMAQQFGSGLCPSRPRIVISCHDCMHMRERIAWNSCQWPPNHRSGYALFPQFTVTPADKLTCAPALFPPPFILSILPIIHCLRVVNTATGYHLCLVVLNQSHQVNNEWQSQ